MGKYKPTTIKTTMATSKRLNQLKKQIGAKSIDELLTTLMNMYKIQQAYYVEPLIHEDLIAYPIGNLEVDSVQEYVTNSLVPQIKEQTNDSKE